MGGRKRLVVDKKTTSFLLCAYNNKIAKAKEGERVGTRYKKR